MVRYKKKMVLDTSLLNAQQYKVHIKGKVEQYKVRIKGKVKQYKVRIKGSGAI